VGHGPRQDRGSSATGDFSTQGQKIRTSRCIRRNATGSFTYRWQNPIKPRRASKDWPQSSVKT
jgi:hypothetical protein